MTKPVASPQYTSMKHWFLAVALMGACVPQEGNVGNTQPDPDAGPMPASVFGATRWAVKLHGDFDDLARVVAIDTHQNVIVSGSFNHSLDFGSGPINTDNPFGSPYLTKRSAGDGGEIWTKTFVLGTEMKTLDVSHIVIDTNDNVYVAGLYSGPVDFEGQTLVGAVGAYLAKLSSSGQLLWLRDLGTDPTAGIRPAQLVVAPDGDIYLAGQLRGTLAYPGGSVTGPAATLDQSRNAALLAAFDPTGTLMWARAFTALDATAVGVQRMSDGDLVFAGEFEGPTGTFGGTPLATETNYAAFLARFSASGDLRWRRLVGGGADGIGNGYCYALGLRSDGSSQLLYNEQGSHERLLTFDGAGATVGSPGPVQTSRASSMSLAISDTDQTLVAGTPPEDMVMSFDGRPISAGVPFIGALDEGGRLADVATFEQGGPVGEVAARQGVVAFVGSVKGTTDFGTGPDPFVGVYGLDSFIVLLDAP